MIARLRHRSTLRRARGLVGRLRLGPISTIDEAVAAVGKSLGCTIIRMPLPQRVPTGLSGLWLTCAAAHGDTVEVILHRSSDEKLSERQDIAHELGHIILHGLAARGDRAARRIVADPGAAGPDTSALSAQLANQLRTIDIGDLTVRSARREGTFGAAEEMYAELIGSVLLARCRDGGKDALIRAFGWSG